MTPLELTHDQAAQMITLFAPGGCRILREMLQESLGFRMQFANGVTIDYLRGEFTMGFGPPVPELKR